MKIKFSSDNLHLNKTLKLHNMTIIIRSVIEEDGKFFQMNVCMNYKCQNMIEQIFQKELMLTKRMHQKSVIFEIIGTSPVPSYKSRRNFQVD